MGFFDALGQIANEVVKSGERRSLRNGQEILFSLSPEEQSDLLTMYLSYYQLERGFDWNKEMNMKITGLLDEPEFDEQSWRQFGSKMTRDYLERIEKESNGIDIINSQSLTDRGALRNFITSEFDCEESVLNALISMNSAVIASHSYTIGTSHHTEELLSETMHKFECAKCQRRYRAFCGYGKAWCSLCRTVFCDKCDTLVDVPFKHIGLINKDSGKLETEIQLDEHMIPDDINHPVEHANRCLSCFTDLTNSATWGEDLGQKLDSLWVNPFTSIFGDEGYDQDGRPTKEKLKYLKELGLHCPKCKGETDYTGRWIYRDYGLTPFKLNDDGSPMPPSPEDILHNAGAWFRD